MHDSSSSLKNSLVAILYTPFPCRELNIYYTVAMTCNQPGDNFWNFCTVWGMWTLHSFASLLLNRHWYLHTLKSHIICPYLIWPTYQKRSVGYIVIKNIREQSSQQRPQCTSRGRKGIEKVTESIIAWVWLSCMSTRITFARVSKIVRCWL